VEAARPSHQGPSHFRYPKEMKMGMGTAECRGFSLTNLALIPCSIKIQTKVIVSAKAEKSGGGEHNIFKGTPVVGCGTVSSAA